MRKTPRLLVALALAAASPAANAIVGPSQTGGPLEPHAVMLLKTTGGASGFCTGIVVSARAILTAAHCVTGAANMRVHYRDAAGAPVLKPVSAVAVHPGYVADGKQRRVVTIDMALVLAAEPLGGRFAPARLSDGEAFAAGDALTLAGFGLGREGEAKSSGVFRHAAITVRAPLSKLLLWAHDAGRKGTGACTGDSGGPIFSAASGAVLAITAWADGDPRHLCGDLTQGVLVAPQREWIDGVLKGWGE